MPVAVYAMRPSLAAAPRTMTIGSTSTSVMPVGSSEAPSASENLTSPPAPRVKSVAPIVSHIARPPQPPKCCPGETDMECAMRRSVGKACGS
jgi:hypothetical protein